MDNNLKKKIYLDLTNTDLNFIYYEYFNLLET